MATTAETLKRRLAKLAAIQDPDQLDAELLDVRRRYEEAGMPEMNYPPIADPEYLKRARAEAEAEADSLSVGPPTAADSPPPVMAQYDPEESWGFGYAPAGAAEPEAAGPDSNLEARQALDRELRAGLKNPNQMSREEHSKTMSGYAKKAADLGVDQKAFSAYLKRNRLDREDTNSLSAKANRLEDSGFGGLAANARLQAEREYDSENRRPIGAGPKTRPTNTDPTSRLARQAKSFDRRGMDYAAREVEKVAADESIKDIFKADEQTAVDRNPAMRENRDRLGIEQGETTSSYLKRMARVGKDKRDNPEDEIPEYAGEDEDDDNDMMTPDANGKSVYNFGRDK